MQKFLIVGLGNPGPEYARTRHNIGFTVINRLAVEYGIALTKTGFSALWGKGAVDGIAVVLAEPVTFMNRSGRAVVRLMDEFGVGQEELIIVHDDIDLQSWQIRVKTDGGSGGHLGVESIIDDLGLENFIRVRVGVGRPPGRMEATDYVLEQIPDSDLEELALAVARAVDAVVHTVRLGVDSAMQEYNKKVL